MVALRALVSGLDAELVRLGYKDLTMVWYRGCWRRMERYFAARGVEEFSLDVAMALVDEACGFFGKEQAGTLKRNECTCSGSPRCWASTRSTGRCCAVITGRSAS